MFDKITFGPIAICSDKHSMKMHIDTGFEEGFFPMVYFKGNIHPEKGVQDNIDRLPPEIKNSYGAVTGFLHMYKPDKIDIC